eukprot:8181699-Alexandrium_andersonii.AAC.1
MLADRVAPHLVRPLRNGSDQGITELQESDEQQVFTRGQLAIEDEYEALDRADDADSSSLIRLPSPQVVSRTDLRTTRLHPRDAALAAREFRLSTPAVMERDV